MNEWSHHKIVNEYSSNSSKNKNWYEYIINFKDLLRLFPKDENTKVLDFGCGPGEFTSKIKENFKLVDGVDIEPMLSIAKKRNSQIDFYTLKEVKDSDKKYDVIFSKLTLQFIKDLPLLIDDLKEIVNDDGYIIFSVPHPETVADKYNLDKTKEVQYSDEIGSTGIRINPINRSLQYFEKTFGDLGFVLIEKSEPLIPDNFLDKYKISKNKPKRLNLKFQKKNTS